MSQTKKNKVAVITGVTGQDGSYLSELLLEKNYRVVGVVRRSSSSNLSRVQHINSPNFVLEYGDVTDPYSMQKIVRENRPDEFYNLAAMSHVGKSFDQPHSVMQINGMGCLNCLEALRLYSPLTRFYQAGTSEQFGSHFTFDFRGNRYQDENTPFGPNSPYGVSKVTAYYYTEMYRKAYNMFAVAGILFNHASVRRGEDFVERKITKYVGRLHNSMCHSSMQIDKLLLGNLTSLRDWGYAPDYVRAMWMMLQQELPINYIIATGQTRTIEDLLNIAFGVIDLNWRDYVDVTNDNLRPLDVPYLCGKADKARKELGWEPTITFEQIIQEMVKHDINQK